MARVSESVCLFPHFSGAILAELRKCPAGHDYWFPGERWKHKDCVVMQSVVTREEPAVVTQSRQVKWQRENRERYNEKMRTYRASRGKAS